METETDIIVLGLGNILLQDEGFGVHFIKWFSENYRVPEQVRLVDGGTLGYGLLDTVTSCKNLLIIDVMKADDTPGSLYRFTRSEMEQRRPAATSAHEVEFVDVLNKADLMDQCPDVVFLCIVPQDIKDMKLEMTPIMHERFSDMEKLLLKELTAFNVHPERLPGA